MDRRILVPLLVLAACRPTAPRAQYVTEWATLPYVVARNEGRPVIEAVRAGAYVAVAMHESFVGEPASPSSSLGGQVNGLWVLPFPPAEGVDGAIAAAEAARTVLDTLFPGSPAPDSLAAAQGVRRRREHVKEPVVQRSVEHGRRVGLAILAWSRADGYATAVRRAQAAKPPRAVNDSDWGALRTFVLRNGDECAAPAAPAYSTRANSEYFAMARALYDSSRSAGPDETAAARYWINDSAGRSASSTWLRIIASSVANAPSAPLAAEGLMLAALAVADAEIASRRQRAREAVAPPTTYLRRTVDANWSPRLVTGEFAYPSVVAVVSAAAVEASSGLGDSLSYVDSAGPGAAKQLFSLSRAGDEAARAGSRLGVTFPLAEQVGLVQGKCIGGRITSRLRPRR